MLLSVRWGPGHMVIGSKACGPPSAAQVICSNTPAPEADTVCSAAAAEEKLKHGKMLPTRDLQALASAQPSF
jgi:hypothetical protein